MSISRKYGRTYHYPFSPGTTSDDRINHNYWDDVNHLDNVIHTEKLDGENNCLSRYGVFARSHVAPTTSAWTQAIRARWALIKNDLGDLEIFGENLYAIHSIEYKKLEHHYYVFAIRINDTWICWEEVKFYAAMFDFPAQAPAIIIPRAAFVGSVTSNQVFLVDAANVARLRKLVAGRVIGDQVEVLQGLNEGDVVITSGQINLNDGSKVAPIK